MAGWKPLIIKSGATQTIGSNDTLEVDSLSINTAAGSLVLTPLQPSLAFVCDSDRVQLGWLVAEWAMCVLSVIELPEYVLSEEEPIKIRGPYGTVGVDSPQLMRYIDRALADCPSPYRVLNTLFEWPMRKRDGAYERSAILTVNFRFVALADLVEGR